MIRASGLPKAPCYFLGRDPLDESIGRVFRCAQAFIARDGGKGNRSSTTSAMPQKKRPQRGRAGAVLVRGYLCRGGRHVSLSTRRRDDRSGHVTVIPLFESGCFQIWIIRTGFLPDMKLCGI